MKRKLKGGATAAIVLFVTSGMLASLLGLRQFDRLNSAPTWVVNADITSGEVIRPVHLSQQPRDKDFSSGSLQNPRELIGKQLVVNKKSLHDALPISSTKNRAIRLSPMSSGFL